MRAPSSGSSPRATSVDSRRRRDEARPARRRGSHRRAVGRSTSSSSWPQTSKPPKQRGRDVVGVALELVGQREAARRRRAGRSPPSTSARARRDAADDRRRRRAEPARVRDPVEAAQARGRGGATPSAPNAARIARTTRWVSSRGDVAGALPVDLDRRARAVDLGGRARRAARARARAQSKPGPRLALVAGTRDPAPAPATKRRASRSPAAAAACVDVGVDDGVDEVAGGLQRGRGVLEPVAGDGDHDGQAGVDVAGGVVGEQPGDAGRRRRLDEHAVAARRAGAARPGSGASVTGVEPAAGLVARPPRRASTTRGCRSGSRSRWSRGRGTARRSRSARRPRPGSPRIRGLRRRAAERGVLA